MARADFLAQVRALGHAVEEFAPGQVVVAFTVPVGRFTGRDIRLGFTVGDDFPLSPPGTLHVSPRLLPINTAGGAHPYAGVHDSAFGTDWQYWSRPIQQWGTSPKNAEVALAHMVRLFETIP